MPGFDGTGPRGMGPMTGGGRGFCAMPMGSYSPYGYGMGSFPYSPPFGPYYAGAYTPPVFGHPFYRPIFGVGRGGIPYGGGRGRAFGGGRGRIGLGFRRWWS
jgi:hypothetical protein